MRGWGWVSFSEVGCGGGAIGSLGVGIGNLMA